MVKEFPIIGELKDSCGWRCDEWTSEGMYLEDGTSEYDLIPVKPLELEGLEIGDYVFAIGRDINIYSAEITGKSVDNALWIESGFQKILIDGNGCLATFGNGQQMFYRSEERALASIKKED